MTQPTRARGRRDRPAEPCFLCDLPTHYGTTCRWCAECRSPSPIAEHASKPGAISELARATGVSAMVLRRAATADGTLSLDQAVAVARELGCDVATLSLEESAGKARARRAAAAARAARAGAA